MILLDVMTVADSWVTGEMFTAYSYQCLQHHCLQVNSIQGSLHYPTLIQILVGFNPSRKDFNHPLNTIHLLHGCRTCYFVTVMCVDSWVQCTLNPLISSYLLCVSPVISTQPAAQPEPKKQRSVSFRARQRKHTVGQKPKKKIKLSAKLSRCINYVQSVHFAGIDSFDGGKLQGKVPA